MARGVSYNFDKDAAAGLLREVCELPGWSYQTVARAAAIDSRELWYAAHRIVTKKGKIIPPRALKDQDRRRLVKVLGEILQAKGLAPDQAELQLLFGLESAHPPPPYQSSIMARVLSAEDAMEARHYPILREQSWRELDRWEFKQALVTQKNAQEAATRGGDPSTIALAQAEEGYARWELGEDGYRPALEASEKALRTLAPDRTVVDPERVLQHLQKKKCEPELQALALALHVTGLSYSRLGRFAEAKAYFDLEGQAAEVLDDNRLRYEPLYWSMREQVLKGTTADPSGSRPLPSDRSHLESALEIAKRGETLGTAQSWWEGYCGYHFSLEAHIHELLGNPIEANRQRQAAIEASAYSPAIILVKLEWAEAVLERNPKHARGLVIETRDRASKHGHPNAISDSLRYLAYFDSLGTDSNQLTQAIDGYVASLLAFPFALGQPDSQSAIEQSARLVIRQAGHEGPIDYWNKYRRSVLERIANWRPPFNYLYLLHTPPNRHLKSVLDCIEKRIKLRTEATTSDSIATAG